MTAPDVTDVTPKKWREPFLDALMQHGNVSRAARTAKISRMQLYRDRAADPEFAAAWQAAQQTGLDSLEDVANVRARRDSDTLLIFLLKAHRPEKYRETTKHINVNLTPEQARDMTDDQIETELKRRGLM